VHLAAPANCIGSETSRRKLPKGLAGTAASKTHAAYRLDTALRAQGTLADLPRQLERTHPGAAGSLREGLDETLTVMRHGVPPTLERTLRSTNPSSR
jgi:putative transposase